MIQTSYTKAREKFAELWSRVIDDREVVIVERRGHEEIAIIAASELSSLLETVYLFRSPKNAERLIAAQQAAERGEGRSVTVDELRKELGLVEKEAARPA